MQNENQSSHSGPVMMKGNSVEAESWIFWDGTGKEDREHLASCHNDALCGDRTSSRAQNER